MSQLPPLILGAPPKKSASKGAADPLVDPLTSHPHAHAGVDALTRHNKGDLGAHRAQLKLKHQARKAKSEKRKAGTVPVAPAPPAPAAAADPGLEQVKYSGPNAIKRRIYGDSANDDLELPEYGNGTDRANGTLAPSDKRRAHEAFYRGYVDAEDLQDVGLAVAKGDLARANDTDPDNHQTLLEHRQNDSDNFNSMMNIGSGGGGGGDTLTDSKLGIVPEADDGLTESMREMLREMGEL